MSIASEAYDRETARLSHQHQQDYQRYLDEVGNIQFQGPTPQPPPKPYTGPFLYDTDDFPHGEEPPQDEIARMHLLNKIYWLTRPFIK